MTTFTLGARNLLKRHIYQLPNNTNWIPSKASPSFSLRLICNIHTTSPLNTAPQVSVRYKTPQVPTRSLSSPFSSSPLSPAMMPVDSKRTPWTYFTHNEADVIEYNMLDGEYRIWGLVIYRCTYKSDSEWEEFMSRFHHQTRRILEVFNGLDMLDSFVPTVMDDKTRFDGVT